MRIFWKDIRVAFGILHKIAKTIANSQKKPVTAQAGGLHSPATIQDEKSSALEG
jgi:hypothetical protein